MRSLRQFGVVLVLLVSYLTPATACMVSDVQMNAEERACCRTMKNQCEQMGMPASHDCCYKAPRSADNALDTKTVTYHPIAVAAVWLIAAQSLHHSSVVAQWLERPDYSPPESASSSISILRI